MPPAKRSAAALVCLVLLGVGLALPADAAPRRSHGRIVQRGRRDRAEREKRRLSRRIFQTAEEYYQVGELELALELYREAHQLAPLPGFLFNIAQCYRRLGEWSRALTYYHAFMAAAPNAPNLEEVHELIALCRDRMASRPSSITARRDRPSPTRVVSVNTVEPMQPRRGPSVRLDAVPSSGASRLASFRAPDDRASRTRRAWMYGSAALSGALALAGTVTGALALSDGDAYQRPGLTAQQRADIRQRGEVMKVSATVSLVLAGTAALTSVVLYLVDRDERSRAARFGVAPLPGGGVGVLAKRF